MLSVWFPIVPAWLTIRAWGLVDVLNYILQDAETFMIGGTVSSSTEHEQHSCSFHSVALSIELYLPMILLCLERFTDLYVYFLLISLAILTNITF